MERDGQRTRAGRPPDAAAAGAGVPLLAGLDPALRTALLAIAGAVRAPAGGRSWPEGGARRALRLAANDLDVEVFGLDLAALERVAGSGRHPAASAAFEVLLVKGLPLELVLPHREDGGVGVPPDPAGTYAEAIAAAAARRDFTCNALYFDPLSGELLDPHGGCADCAAGRLRHTSARFTEDPLRVLRGMQLIARFELTPAPETVALCRTLSPAGLAPERSSKSGVSSSTGSRSVAVPTSSPPPAGSPTSPVPGVRRYRGGSGRISGGRPPHPHRPQPDAFARADGRRREDRRRPAVLCRSRRPGAASDGAAGATATLSFLGRMTRETALLDEVVLVRERPRLLASPPRRTTPRPRQRPRASRPSRPPSCVARGARRALAPPVAGFPSDRLLARARELGWIVLLRRPSSAATSRLGLSRGGDGRSRRPHERQLDGEITTLEEGLARPPGRRMSTARVRQAGGRPPSRAPSSSGPRGSSARRCRRPEACGCSTATRSCPARRAGDRSAPRRDRRPERGQPLATGPGAVRPPAAALVESTPAAPTGNASRPAACHMGSSEPGASSGAAAWHYER